MTNWPWDWEFQLEDQQESPLSSSPLRSLSSPSSLEIFNVENVAQESLHSAERGRDRRGVDNYPESSRSLVQTLQECLTSLPQHTNKNDCARQSLSDPSGTAPTTSRTYGSSSKPLGLTKLSPKRRPRPSRRTPVTVIEANPWEFRDTVQRLTGIRAAPNSNSSLVRPQPKRPNPSIFVRPDHLQPNRPFSPFSYPTPQLVRIMSPPSPPMNPLMPLPLPQPSASELTVPQFPMRESIENISDILYRPEFRPLMSSLWVPSVPEQQFWQDEQNSSGNVSNLGDELNASGSLPLDFPGFRNQTSNG